MEADQIQAEGNAIGPRDNMRPGIFGRIRAVATFSRLEKAFFWYTAIGVLIAMGYTIYRMATLKNDSDDIVLAALALINLGFCCYYLAHGMRQGQPYEIIVLLLTFLALTLYCGLDFLDPDRRDTHKLIRLIISLVGTFIVSALGIPVLLQYLTGDPGYLIFRIVGANGPDQVMCRNLFIFCTLIIFGLQAMASCLILVNEGGFQVLTATEICIMAAGGYYSLAWAILGHISVRLESTPLSCLFVVMTVTLPPAYAIWRFTKELLSRDNLLLFVCIVASIAILGIVHAILLRFMWLVYLNFNRGLKEKVYGNSGTVQRNNLENGDPNQLAVPIAVPDVQPIL